ncbi:MAG TPA: IgA Peptidase M64 [candidate division Zixibacteria bacterium]|nr:IgA Peptidase M64 [candidate division Zixibacteria bacterium]
MRASAQQSGAGVASTPRTMRVDYFHTGNAMQQWFSLDRVVIEPLPWPGDPEKAIDGSQLGNYRFEVREKESGKLVYSRGFNSVYGEWCTTEEARHANRTFSESLRFPTPAVPVEISLQERKEGSFREVWKSVVDPKDKFVDTSRPPSPGPLLELQKMGTPSDKVDLLLLGDGYTATERGKFESDARRYMEMLFSISPFREHRKDFNVWALCPAAEESGVSRPSSGIHRRSPVGASYDTFGTERYILTTENRALRDIASFAPYEFVEILVNSATYGGGGIFNQYATVAIDNQWASYVGVHEFGHQFAALADEYYTSDVAYLPPENRTEPWEPNVTALLNPADLKWKDLVEKGTPIPTPWDKDEFDRFERGIQQQRKELRAAGKPEAKMEELFRTEREKEDAMLASQKFAGKVGAFEGANYESKGYYRPEVNCIMFTRHNAFCKVCRRAIDRVIQMYAK